MRGKFGIFLGLFLSVLVGYSSAGWSGEDPIHNLSQTGLYSDIVGKVINPGNLFFTPQYPLWTDGAKKQRWVMIPAGIKINTDNPNNWKFPVGTKVWKEFAFEETDGKVKRIETRLIEKKIDGTWSFLSFLWNEDETDASLAPISGVKDYYKINDEVSYDIPSKANCVFCHGGGIRDPILGIDALQLSPLRDGNAIHGTPLTAEMVSLTTLLEANLITAAISPAPEIIESLVNPLQKRMFGYFHGNCSSCHNPHGSANYTGLFLNHILGTQLAHEEQAYVTTVGVKTEGYDIPGLEFGETYRIQPGKPEVSALFHRMNVLDFDRMPPVATKVIDQKAVSTLKNLIIQFVVPPQ